MTADATPLDHPLRSRNDVPRSDLRRATQAVGEAFDAMFAAHANGSSQAGDDETPEKQQVMRELTRCIGGRAQLSGVAVGDVIVQVTCDDEAGAAAVSAVVNHTGLAGKASWFKGGENGPWIVLVVPTR